MRSQAITDSAVMRPVFGFSDGIFSIDIENRAVFMSAGGRRYEYVPALNAGAGHVQCLAAVIARHAAPRGAG